MHTRRVKRTRNDLRGIPVRPVAPEIGNVATPVHLHRVPRKQPLVIEPPAMIAKNIGHEIGGTCLA